MSIPYPPGKALTCREVRELDVLSIEHVGIPGIVLMENAGRHAAEFIYSILPNPGAAHVALLCGVGNNGGDGFVIARHLHNAGVAIDVLRAGPAEKATGDARTNLDILGRMQVNVVPATTETELAAVRPMIERAAVIVDALLGTGSRGAPRGVMGTLVEWANAAQRARRVAIDVPSGLDADAGTPSEPCFRADATITMLAPKVGFREPTARDYVGRVIAVDISTPRELIPGRGEFMAGG